MLPQTRSSVLYQRSPLIDGTCQVAFPQNLQISAAPPVGFQTKVKTLFPNFSLTQDKSSYNFTSADQRQQVVLGRASLAVVTRHYEGWEQFQKSLKVVLEALQTEYPHPM